MVSSDNKFFQALEHIVDLLILNILFIICSVPLVTVYPAFVALVGTIKYTLEGGGMPIWKRFFTLFYQYAIKGVRVWIVLLFSTAIIVGNMIGFFYLSHELQNFFLPFTALSILLFLGVFINVTKLFVTEEGRHGGVFTISFFQLIKSPWRPLMVIGCSLLLGIISIHFKYIGVSILFSAIGFFTYIVMGIENESEGP